MKCDDVAFRLRIFEASGLGLYLDYMHQHSCFNVQHVHAKKARCLLWTWSFYLETFSVDRDTVHCIIPKKKKKNM